MSVTSSPAQPWPTMTTTHLGFLCSDAVDGKASLAVVDQSKMLSSLFNADHIWEKIPVVLKSVSFTTYG